MSKYLVSRSVSIPKKASVIICQVYKHDKYPVYEALLNLKKSFIASVLKVQKKVLIFFLFPNLDLYAITVIKIKNFFSRFPSAIF